MLLIEQIHANMMTAKKEHNTVKAGLLNTLYAEAVRVGKDAGNRATTDLETIAMIKKFLKGIEETLSFIKEDSNTKQALLLEQQILNAYLPKQLSKEELQQIIVNLNTKNVGEIMKHLKENYAGFYDGQMASALAKSI